MKITEFELQIHRSLNACNYNNLLLNINQIPLKLMIYNTNDLFIKQNQMFSAKNKGTHYRTCMRITKLDLQIHLSL